MLDDREQLDDCRHKPQDPFPSRMYQVGWKLSVCLGELKFLAADGKSNSTEGNDLIKQQMSKFEPSILHEAVCDVLR